MHELQVHKRGVKMGNREVHEEPDLQCDVCGEYGAYDFYGDAICQKCIDENKSKSRVRRKVAQKKTLDKQK